MRAGKRIFSMVLALACCAGALTGCGSNKGTESRDVVIWTSGEDYRNEYYLNSLRERFPDYNITLEYMNTSTIAAKVKEEGDKAAAIPTSYTDLLDPQYKGLISMPSPATSGTGYMFLRQLVDKWGEEAFALFERFS